MTTPIVSIVMPVHNAAAHLRACLNSIVEQTLREIEIICVDDGSQDESALILREYEQRDIRFMVLTQKNQGPGPARNLGISQACGKYLICLDADDLYENTLLETMVQKAEETAADLVICNSNPFDSDSSNHAAGKALLNFALLGGKRVFSPAEFPNDLFQLIPGWPWDKLLRRDFVLQHHLQYPALPNSQDLVFIFPAMALAQRICVIEEMLIHHRVNRKNSVSNSRDRAADAPWQAFCLFRDILKKNGLFERYEKALLRWAMNFFLWHINTLSDKAVQRTCYYTARKKWFPEIGFGRFTPNLYPRNDYLKYRMICFLPYRIYRSLLKTAKKAR